MSEAQQQKSEPPKLRFNADRSVENSSFADTVEWFLNFDERTARIRHPMVEELFQWKQRDDEENGVGVYPFENAEARFAIGCFQAVGVNNSAPLLKLWITDVLNALQEATQTKTEIAEANNLDAESEMFALVKAEKLTTKAERRLYLASSWHEALFTAEARVLGWVYQEIYGVPFAP